LNTAYTNLYQFVIGRKFSKQDLGYYSRADQFAQFPSSNITGIMQRVTYPILCTMADDDDKLLAAYRQYIKLAAYIVFPLMVGLAAIAKPLIIVILGQKWESTAIILQIICFSYLWYPIHALNLNLLAVKGRSDLFLRVELLKKIIGISILLVVMRFNLKVMAIGNIISSIISLFINTYYTNKLLSYGILKQVRDIVVYLLLSICSCLPAFILCKVFNSNVLLLASSILISVSTYMLLSRILRIPEFPMIFGSLSNAVRENK
jgi:O-antigen/teichoic acid export membrane protein